MHVCNVLSFRERYIRIWGLIEAVMEAFGLPIIMTMVGTFWTCFSELYDIMSVVIKGDIPPSYSICMILSLASALIRFIALVESSHYLLSAVSPDSVFSLHCCLSESDEFVLGQGLGKRAVQTSISTPRLRSLSRFDESGPRSSNPAVSCWIPYHSSIHPRLRKL